MTEIIKHTAKWAGDNPTCTVEENGKVCGKPVRTEERKSTATKCRQHWLEWRRAYTAEAKQKEERERELKKEISRLELNGIKKIKIYQTGMFGWS